MTGPQSLAAVVLFAVLFILAWTAWLFQRGQAYERMIEKLDRHQYVYERIALALEKLARGEKPDV